MRPFFAAKRALGLLLLCAASSACNSGDASDPAQPDQSVPPTEDSWFQPAASASWQWQIEGALNASYAADVYDIDTFENDSESIRGLHDSGRKVVCYFSAGTFESWRHDAADYPESIVGKPLADWPDERWVDIRSLTLREILEKRLDIAAANGCDGVEPDNVTAFRNDSGFDLTPEDQLAFNRWLADEAHARGMGVGLKNDGEQASELEPWFDFSVNEECHFYGECDQLQPFFSAGKPVFNAEYVENEAQANALAPTLCPEARALGTRTLILPWNLDDAFRVSCDDSQQ